MHGDPVIALKGAVPDVAARVGVQGSGVAEDGLGGGRRGRRPAAGGGAGVALGVRGRRGVVVVDAEVGEVVGGRRGARGRCCGGRGARGRRRRRGLGVAPAESALGGKQGVDGVVDVLGYDSLVEEGFEFLRTQEC